MRQRHLLLTRLLALAAVALALAACGNEVTPIAVYVTPTAPPTETAPAAPVETAAPIEASDTSGSAAVLTGNALAQPSPAPTDPPDTPPPAVVAQEVTPTEYIITPRATISTPPHGANFGPIVGPDYTPGPLASPLPTIDAPQACPAIVTAPEVSLYAEPSLGSAVTGTAAMANRLVVTLLHTDPSGGTWANTEQGWLPLTVGGTQYAQLDSVRMCQIMTGEEINRTLLGLHMVNWTSEQQIYQFVQRLHDAGIPLGTLKGLSGTERILNQVEQMSPETVTVYRAIVTQTQGQSDCPTVLDSQVDPVEAAQKWYAELEPSWRQVSADYYETMNECPAKLSWIAGFSIEMMRLANEDGYCLLLFSFPGGNPPIEEFDELLPAYQYAAENPCQPGRTHGISLHSYSDEELKFLSETGVWNAFRHRIFYQRLMEVLPAGANLPVYITEAGQGSGTQFHELTCDALVRDAIQYTNLLEGDPYVKGFHLWSFGDQWPWVDYTECLPQLADALIGYYQAR